MGVRQADAQIQLFKRNRFNIDNVTCGASAEIVESDLLDRSCPAVLIIQSYGYGMIFSVRNVITGNASRFSKALAFLACKEQLIRIAGSAVSCRHHIGYLNRSIVISGDIGI